MDAMRIGLTSMIEECPYWGMEYTQKNVEVLDGMPVQMALLGDIQIGIISTPKVSPDA